MANILVTGGAGFIGSHLVEKLIQNKHSVIVIDNLKTGRKQNLNNVIENKKFKFVKYDITDKKKLNKYFRKIDIVFHLAALAEIVPSIENPDEYFETNVAGTLNVLEASKKNNVKKIIYAASSSCYGLPKKFPTSEKENIDCRYPYALTKHLGEQMILHWSKVFKINAISLRLFNVYGPRSRTSGTYGAVFGVFLAQKFAKKPFTVVGDGKQKRDFTYVSDVVDCFIKSGFSKLSDQIFNVGTGKAKSINSLVKLLKGEVVYIPKRPGEPDITQANINKIKTFLGWAPKVSFENGVKKVLAEKAQWKNAPLWNEVKIKNATKLWFKYLK